MVLLFLNNFIGNVDFLDLLLIEIQIKPHIKTSICFSELDTANLTVFVFLLGNHLLYGVNFSVHLNDREENDVSKHNLY